MRGPPEVQEAAVLPTEWEEVGALCPALPHPVRPQPPAWICVVS